MPGAGLQALCVAPAASFCVGPLPSNYEETQRSFSSPEVLRSRLS